MLSIRWKWLFNQLAGIVIMILIFSYGGLIHFIINKDSGNDHYKNEKIYLFKVKETYHHELTSGRYLAEFYHAIKKYEYISDTYVYFNIPLVKLKKGDIIISNSTPFRIDRSRNTSKINSDINNDVRKVLFSCIISDTTSFKHVGYDNDVIDDHIRGAQSWIINTLQNALKDKKNYGLAEAILIGYRNDLDRAILGSYVNTGVVHVIAISGLHIGLIFMIFSMIIKTLSGSKHGKWASLFITIPAIWWFTMLTGSSASVVRSAIMISYNILANLIGKKPKPMNSLLAAAFIQLIYNPNITADLGFQLSYMAVGSILIFNPLFTKLFYVKNQILKEGWSMVSITVSAQVLTTPISIYHFHQFPMLFLITNLVAVPLSSLVLLLEILLCVLKLISFDTVRLSKIINLIIDIMNGYIYKIEGIPFAVVTDLFIGIITVALLYLLILFCRYWIQFPSRKGIIMILSLITIISVYHNFQKISTYKKRIIVLNIPRQTCFILQNGNQAVLIANEKLISNNRKINWIKTQLKNQYWLDNIELKSIPNTSLMISLDNLTHELADRKRKFLMITGNPYLELEKLSNLFDSSTLLIADASNKLWKIQQWETEADKLLLRFHSVVKNGPFVVESPNILFSTKKY